MTGLLQVLRADAGPVAERFGGVIGKATFLAQVADLADRLPPNTHVVNFCSDRYHFAVAWIAAMLRGQVTLLPATRQTHAVRELRAGYPDLYVLTDDPDEQWPAETMRYPALTTGGTDLPGPAFPADQVAAVLFTSGSTGRPQPNTRLWGRLVAGCHAAGIALGADHHAGRRLIATVPHAHSYGLESAVLLPLRFGLVLTAGRPFFPADIAAELQRAVDPAVLVTTPVHLRAVLAGAPAPIRAAFILSATAPLSTALAAQAEAASGAPVHEIYGCSEAGQLATRRTLEGPAWRTLDGFRLYQAAGETWASGPAEPDVRLADAVETLPDNRFLLLGRSADQVNIAGKRSSLGYLTQQLLAVPGVTDGVFVLPDSDAPTPRLAALAVAPGLSASAILHHLGQRLDPAFMPRPLRVVDAMPRNALGKLPRAELLRLLGTPVRLRIPAGHPAGPGHFPGNPIVPGAVLLDHVATALFPDGWYGRLDAAKFHHPVRPGDTMLLTIQTDGDKTRFEAHLHPGRQLVLSGILRPPSAPQ